MIGDTIKQLRKVHNLSQETFASKIGVSQTTVTSWETGKAEPTSSIIVKIANYFNVSTDFILDVNNSKQPFSLGNKIKKLRKIHNLNQSELGKILNVSQQAITAWETNRSIPGADTLLFLADYFNVSADELLGREPHYQTNDLNEMIDIADTFEDDVLLPKDKRVIRGIIKGYLNS
ncbi:helix-turn-helix domain-containing protein [Ligilactobacillus salivarius]|uniref:helix-turn-helix domain-containing protein n=1 Tax=Ligilactobacillus salivarius TaxID=1624 RepID=UPI000C7DDF13|nr:helix-turn-helix transcriptional regulator [Ligilactobacillus salivarius]PLA90515.1 hypothetical protein CYR84_08790 [Ligilactobacillus salivarius]